MHLKFYIYELQIRIYELHCFARADSSEALWSTALHKCRSWSELNRSQHTWKSFIIPIVTILYRWDLNIHKLSNCIPRVCASNNDNHESWQSKKKQEPSMLIEFHEAERWQRWYDAYDAETLRASQFFACSLRRCWRNWSKTEQTVEGVV